MPKIEGRAQLERQLAAISPRFREAVMPVMQAEAQRLADLARELAPEDRREHPRHPLGALKASIAWKWVETSGKLLISVTAGNAQAFYDVMVEHGTRPHSTRRGADLSRRKRQEGGRQHPGAKPEPYFMPAWRALKGEILSRIKKAAKDAVSQ